MGIYWYLPGTQTVPVGSNILAERVPSILSVVLLILSVPVVLIASSMPSTHPSHGSNTT